MKIKDISKKIDELIPLKLAQDWDNVGLLVGDGNKNAKNILLTIDITTEVIEEAKKLKSGLIVSYHPVIWDGLKNVTPDSSGNIVYELITNNISVFSIHTALDVVAGGVNDGLAEMIGLENTEPIGDYVEVHEGDNYKMVVFVPSESIARICNSIFAAGAGWIGNYSNCGFTSQGQGTFKPLKGSNPAIGKHGRTETVPEIRFETIIPSGKLQTVIEAMKQAHPYEEPAYDIFKLHNDKNRFGLGRIGTLSKPTRLADIIKKIKKATQAKAFGIIGDEKRLIKKAAVCAGSCGKIINNVMAAGCDLYLTGELKHHQAMAARDGNLTCICLSHTVSERFILKKLAKQLQKTLPKVTIKISKKDKDPFNWKNL